MLTVDGITIGFSGGSSGGGGAFTPTLIGGLQCWIDASALTGYVDGDNVTSFTERSDYARVFGGGTLKYRTNRLNGLPALSFETQAQISATGWTPFTETYGLTLIVARKWRSGRLFLASDTSGAVAVSDWSTYYGETAVRQNQMTLVPTLIDGWALYTWYSSPGGISLRQNGVQIAALSATPTPLSLAAFYLGGDGGDGGSYDGEVGEELHYGRITADPFDFSDIIDAESYLIAKWGLT